MPRHEDNVDVQVAAYAVTRKTQQHPQRQARATELINRPAVSKKALPSRGNRCPAVVRNSTGPHGSHSIPGHKGQARVLNHPGVPDLQSWTHSPDQSTDGKSLVVQLNSISSTSTGQSVNGQNEYMQDKTDGSESSVTQGDDAFGESIRYLMSQDKNSISTSSLGTALDTALFDPFMSTIVPLDRKKSFMLTFFLRSVISQTNWTRSYTQELLRYNMRMIVDSQLFMYSVLCRTSVEFAAGGGKLSNLIVESQTGADAADLLQEFLGYKAELKAELDKVFSNTSSKELDQPTLQGMVLLIRMEAISGSVVELIPYLKSFWRVKAPSHLVAQLPPAVSAILSITVFIAAASCREVPPFTPPMLSDIAISQPTLDAMCSIRTPMMSAFLDKSISAIIPPKILTSVTHLRAPLLFKSLIATKALLPSPRDYAVFVNIQQRAQYNLLNLPEIGDLSPWQECVRLAVLIAVMTTDVQFLPNHSYSRNIVWQLRKSCQEVLSLSSMNLSEGRSGSGSDAVKRVVMIWILFLGALLSKGLKERPWFVLKLAKTMKDVAIESQEVLRECLKKFIYLDWVYEEKLQEVWAECEGLKSVLDIM